MTETDTKVIKHDFDTGGEVAGLVPKSFDEAYRLSRALSSADGMIPKEFSGKPEAVLAAIMRGAEIGLAPMQALSSIAVINGRATVWGDALPALMLRAGHTIDVQVEGEGEDMRAIATLARGDTGQIVEREFSMRDARAANLLSKNSPWQTYPKRMLMHRARSWAVRDGAADALMGLQVREEVEDYQPAKDVTPKPSNSFAERANAAKRAAEETQDTEDDTIDGTAEEVDETQADEATTKKDSATAQASEAEDSPPSSKSGTSAKASKSSKSAKPSQKTEQKKEADKSASDGAEQSDKPTPAQLKNARTAGSSAFAEGFDVDQSPLPEGPLRDAWKAGWNEEQEAAG